MSGRNLERGAGRRRILRAIDETPDEDGADPETAQRGDASSAERPALASEHGQSLSGPRASTDPVPADASGPSAGVGGPAETGSATDTSTPRGAGIPGGSDPANAAGAADATAESRASDASSGGVELTLDWCCPTCGTSHWSRPETCRCCGRTDTGES